MVVAGGWFGLVGWLVGWLVGVLWFVAGGLVCAGGLVLCVGSVSGSSGWVAFLPFLGSSVLVLVTLPLCAKLTHKKH